jgi:ADP-ribose pyrophosphatase
MSEDKKTPASIPGKLSTRRIYTGKILSLDVDRVRFPDGSTGELEMIRHSGASAIVPILENDRLDPEILLIRQYRYAAGGYVFEIPAGRLDDNETPEDCARRELQEETGYMATRMRHLATIYTTPGFTDERIHLFAGEGLTAGKDKREPDEFLELHPVLLSKALDMIRAGEIIDGKTIAGLFLVKPNPGPE